MSDPGGGGGEGAKTAGEGGGGGIRNIILFLSKILKKTFTSKVGAHTSFNCLRNVEQHNYFLKYKQKVFRTIYLVYRKVIVFLLIQKMKHRAADFFFSNYL